MSDTPIYDSLKPKYRAFLDEYMVDYNGKRAAIASGYSANGADVQASRMLARPMLRQALAELEAVKREKTYKRVEKSASWVIQQLEDLVQEALDHGDRSNANRSLETLAKYHGLLTDKIQINKEKPEELDEAELSRIAKGQTEHEHEDQDENTQDTVH